MLEFTNLLKVSPVGQTDTYEFMADYFDFSPTSSDDDGGLVYDCGKTFVIDLPDTDVLAFFRFPRLCTVTLKTSAQTLITIGTCDIPARVHIAPHLQKAQLIMECKMLKSPL